MEHFCAFCGLQGKETSTATKQQRFAKIFLFLNATHSLEDDQKGLQQEYMPIFQLEFPDNSEEQLF